MSSPFRSFHWAPESTELKVLRVDGRYPHHPRPLHAQNIRALVTDLEDGTLRIRLDDAQNDEAWLEITMQINSQAVDPTAD